MNDLYLESCPLETDLEDLECDECECYIVEVTRAIDGEFHYVAAYTAEEASLPQRLCDGCADKLAAAYKGNVHDRREDAETLLDAIAPVLVRIKDLGFLPLDLKADAAALLDRMIRR